MMFEIEGIRGYLKILKTEGAFPDRVKTFKLFTIPRFIRQDQLDPYFQLNMAWKQFQKIEYDLTNKETKLYWWEVS